MNKFYRCLYVYFLLFLLSISSFICAEGRNGANLTLVALGHTDARFHNALNASWVVNDRYEAGLLYAKETFGRASQETKIAHISARLPIELLKGLYLSGGIGVLEYDTIVPALPDGLVTQKEYNFGLKTGIQYQIMFKEPVYLQFSAGSLIAPAGAGALFLVTGRVHYIGIGFGVVL